MLGRMYCSQSAMVFSPAPVTYIPPKMVGAPADFQVLNLALAPNLNVQAWYALATTRPYTSFFFHGSSDNLVMSHKKMQPFDNAGYGTLLAEYPGYFGMRGHPRTELFDAEARACLRFLAGVGIPAPDTFLMDHSLGTAVATHLAHETPVASIILAAPFTSLVGLLALSNPVFPSRWLSRNRLEYMAPMRCIHAPVLIMHCPEYAVVPLVQCRAVIQAAHEPKTSPPLPNAGHEDPRGYEAIALEWPGPLPLPAHQLPQTNAGGLL